MRVKNSISRTLKRDHGATLLIVALSMTFVLGMLGLGIDLASLYVGRTQAQRAADAAALAGAQSLVDSGYAAGVAGSASNAQALATQRALSVGNQNLVAGVSPNMSASDLSFNFSNSQDPQITVVAARDTAHGNPMPTFFMKIFGIQSANVTATATAEAYDASGENVSVAPTCVKPWLMPNCDFGQPPVSGGNPNCPNSSGTAYYPYLINPANGSLEFPGFAPAGSIGEDITLKPGSPSAAATAGQFFAVQLPVGTLSCPSCANNGGGSGGSASNYGNAIECCNQLPIVDGQTITVQVVTGDKTGPTGAGVDCLINENGSNGTGQDTISFSGSSYTITAGPNNPLFPPGTSISPSNSTSVVTVPVYDGHTLCPGGPNSCPANNNITIVGFLQVFITGELNSQQHTVYGYILNVVGGNAGTGNNGGIVSTGGGSPIPVRLIHQ
jgi:hypothetical protein